MRILSVFKDYYDFPPFGYDTNDEIVYDRVLTDIEIPHNPNIPTPDNFYVSDHDLEHTLGIARDAFWRSRTYNTRLKEFYLSICDKVYGLCLIPNPYGGGHCTIYDHHQRPNDDGVNVPRKVLTTLNSFENSIAAYINSTWRRKTLPVTDGSLIDVKWNLNTLHDCPVLLYESFAPNSSKDRVIKNPSLRGLGFEKLSIEQIYQEIEMFIGIKKDVVEDTMTDKEKVVSKGFDPKRGFRH